MTSLPMRRWLTTFVAVRPNGAPDFDGARIFSYWFNDIDTQETSMGCRPFDRSSTVPTSRGLQSRSQHECKIFVREE